MVGTIGTVVNIVGGNMKTRTKSDKQRILDLLRRNENGWVCSMTIMSELFIKDYAQRISDLRADNHNIDGERCTIHDHKPFMYRLNVSYNHDSLF